MPTVITLSPTLHSRRREPKSIFHISLLPNPERQESGFVAYWWRISGPYESAPHTRQPPYSSQPPIRVSLLLESVSYSSQSHTRVSLILESASHSSQPPVQVSLPFKSASYSSHLLNYTIRRTYSHLNQH
jgi:hypothetical protein